MIVYVETNFLLELAYEQEEHAACDALLRLASDGHIRLCIPAFSVVEARVAWRNQVRKRAEFHEALRRELRELTRSKPHSDLGAKSTDLVAALVGAGEADRRRLGAAIGAVEGSGAILPLDAETVRAAFGAENLRNLSAQDATVYASVQRHLTGAGGGPKCFLNRNSRDFALPEIVEELARYGCRMFASFAAGLGHVRSALQLGTHS